MDKKKIKYYIPINININNCCQCSNKIETSAPKYLPTSAPKYLPTTAPKHFPPIKPKYFPIINTNLDNTNQNCYSRKCGSLNTCNIPSNYKYFNTKEDNLFWRFSNAYNQNTYDYNQLVLNKSYSPTADPTDPFNKFFGNPTFYQYTLKSNNNGPNIDFETDEIFSYLSILNDINLDDSIIIPEGSYFKLMKDNTYLNSDGFYFQPINCGNDCLSFINDNDNCGKCGNKCQNGYKCCGKKCIPISVSETCAEHDCYKNCEDGSINCGGVCVPLNNINSDCTCKNYYYGDSCDRNCLNGSVTMYDYKNNNTSSIFNLYKTQCCADALNSLLQYGNLYTPIQNLSNFITQNKITNSSLLILLVGNLTLNTVAPSLLTKVDDKTFLILNTEGIAPVNFSITNNDTQQTVNYSNIQRKILQVNCENVSPYPWSPNYRCQLQFDPVEFDANNSLNYKKYSIPPNGSDANLPEILLIGPEFSQDSRCSNTCTHGRCLYPGSTCPPNYDQTDPNCQKCANNWFGINCDECPDNFNVGNNCKGCINYWQGPNCDQCPNTVKQDGNCNEIIPTSLPTISPCIPKCPTNCGQNNGCGGICPNTNYNDIRNNPLISQKRYWNLYFGDSQFVSKLYPYPYDPSDNNLIIFSDSTLTSPNSFILSYINNTLKVGNANGNFSQFSGANINFDKTSNTYNILLPQSGRYTLIPSFCDSKNPPS